MLDPRLSTGWTLVLTTTLAALLASTGPARAHDEPKEEPVSAESKETKPRVETDLEWYGYVKLDASWDESLVDSGNFARWVASPSIVEDHSHFNMTARQTRLGFTVRRKTGDAPPISGRVEIDFYGDGAENKNRPQLRHAYLEVPWPKQGLDLVAGQASDVISPLVPTTINYTVAWWVGNIGYRRPLAKLTRTIASEGGGATRLTAAIWATSGKS